MTCTRYTGADVVAGGSGEA